MNQTQSDADSMESNRSSGANRDDFDQEEGAQLELFMQQMKDGVVVQGSSALDARNNNTEEEDAGDGEEDEEEQTQLEHGNFKIRTQKRHLENNQDLASVKLSNNLQHTANGGGGGGESGDGDRLQKNNSHNVQDKNEWQVGETFDARTACNPLQLLKDKRRSPPSSHALSAQKKNPQQKRMIYNENGDLYCDFSNSKLTEQEQQALDENQNAAPLALGMGPTTSSDGTTGADGTYRKRKDPNKEECKGELEIEVFQAEYYRFLQYRDYYSEEQVLQRQDVLKEYVPQRLTQKFIESKIEETEKLFALHSERRTFHKDTSYSSAINIDEI